MKSRKRQPKRSSPLSPLIKNGTKKISYLVPVGSDDEDGNCQVPGLIKCTRTVPVRTALPAPLCLQSAVYSVDVNVDDTRHNNTTHLPPVCMYADFFVCTMNSSTLPTPPSSSSSSSSWQPTSRDAKIKKLKFIVLGGANAGKTSILRKYFKGVFDPARRPTVGSDFYTKKMPNPVPERDGEDSSSSSTEDEKKEARSPLTMTHEHPRAMLSMQVWDTPGRERFAANQTKPMYTAAFSDNFFKNADAALLVYDITSSTSFTHVLKWYEDLMTRIRRLEASGGRTRSFPVLIVGNKIDILRERDTHPSRQRAVVPQRDVMGLIGHSFRGKDYHYEYTASAPPSNDSSTSLSSGKKKKKKNRARHELSTYMGTGEKTNYLQAVLNNEFQIGSYLESLLSTEDGSHPDRDMVLLWCMRNGLKHMEVSALDGTGVEELINEAISLALDAGDSGTTKNEPENGNTEVMKLAELGRNAELDLHGRYGPKAQSCFMLPFRLCCKP